MDTNCLLHVTYIHEMYIYYINDIAGELLASLLDEPEYRIMFGASLLYKIYTEMHNHAAVIYNNWKRTNLTESRGLRDRKSAYAIAAELSKKSDAARWLIVDRPNAQLKVVWDGMRMIQAMLIVFLCADSKLGYPIEGFSGNLKVTGSSKILRHDPFGFSDSGAKVVAEVATKQRFKRARVDSQPLNSTPLKDGSTAEPTTDATVDVTPRAPSSMPTTQQQQQQLVPPHMYNPFAAMQPQPHIPMMMQPQQQHIPFMMQPTQQLAAAMMMSQPQQSGASTPMMMQPQQQGMTAMPAMMMQPQQQPGIQMPAMQMCMPQQYSLQQQQLQNPMGNLQQ